VAAIWGLRRQRLLNQARRKAGVPGLLQYFAMERFLYRLTKSRFADRFVLKGALLLTAWRRRRPANDGHRSGRKDQQQVGGYSVVVGEVCDSPLNRRHDFTAPRSRFSASGRAEYDGVRVRFSGTSRRRESDADRHWFWDVIVPGPIEIEYPAMLESRRSAHGYPKETVVAEKPRPSRPGAPQQPHQDYTTSPAGGLYRLTAMSWLRHWIDL